MNRWLGVLVALAACGDPSGTDAPDVAGSVDASVGASVDAPVDAGGDPEMLGPRWIKRFPGLRVGTQLVPLGARLAVSTGRISGGDVVLAPGEPGEVALTGVDTRAVLWLEALDGAVTGGRILGGRGSAGQVGGLYPWHLAVADGDALLIGGEFMGQVRFFPDVALRTEQATYVPGTSPLRAAHDPYLVRFDAAFAPSAFARGTTSGTLSVPAFNDLTGLAPLAAGARMIAGMREAPMFGVAGEAIPSKSYLARLDASGQVAWVRQMTGQVTGARLFSAGADTYFVAELHGTATLFAGTPDEITLTWSGSGDWADGVVGRVDASGRLLWVRTIAANLQDLGAVTLSDGRLLVSAPTRLTPAPFAIRDATGGVITSGTAPGYQTVLAWFTPSGGVSSTVVAPWSTFRPIELASGHLAASVYWSPASWPAELAAIAPPADTTAEALTSGVAILSPAGAPEALHVIGVNGWVEPLVPIAGGFAIAWNTSAPPQETEPSYLIDGDGAWAREPACLDDNGCLAVAAYRVGAGLP